jgi:hypothetical protein
MPRSKLLMKVRLADQFDQPEEAIWQDEDGTFVLTSSRQPSSENKSVIKALGVIRSWRALSGRSGFLVLSEDAAAISEIEGRAKS